MIRFVTCFRRRRELSAREFRALWDSPDFDLLIARMANAARANRWAKNATLVVGANVLVQQVRGTDDPFDGILEYFLDGAGHFANLMNDPAFCAVELEMRAYQASFADMERSVAFFTEAR